MVFLFFLGGVAFGTIITRIVLDLRTSHGHFYLEPADEDDTGFYKVNISITPNQNLLKKKYIILEKDNSPK